MFQYSFCSYSTNRKHDSIKRWKVSIQLLFLFNQLPKIIDVFLEVFQYSFCSYSTNRDAKRRNLYRVSIQLLFLFNWRWCNCNKTDVDVSIQLLFLFNRYRQPLARSVFKFQYSFCSYSTVCYSDAWKISGGFNTASVLIQQIKGVWRDGIA